MVWKTLRRNWDWVRLYGMTTLALASLCGSAAAAQGSSTHVLITEAVTNKDRVVLNKSVRPMVKRGNDLGAAPTSLTAGHMAMVLNRSAAQQTALKQYLRDVQNPKSASYRQWLTPAQFGERFGASVEDIKTIATWLTAQGFTVKPMAAGRNVIFFSGSVRSRARFRRRSIR